MRTCLGKPGVLVSCLLISLSVAPQSARSQSEELRPCLEPEGMPATYTRKAAHYHNPFSVSYQTQWANYRAYRVMYLEQLPTAPSIPPSYHAPGSHTGSGGQWIVEQAPSVPASSYSIPEPSFETLPVVTAAEVDHTASPSAQVMPLEVATPAVIESPKTVTKSAPADAAFKIRRDPSRANDMEYIQELRKRWQAPSHVQTAEVSEKIHSTSAKPVSWSRKAPSNSSAPKPAAKPSASSSTKQGGRSGDLQLFQMPKWTPIETKMSVHTGAELPKPAPVKTTAPAKTTTVAKPWTPISKVEADSVELMPVEPE